MTIPFTADLGAKPRPSALEDSPTIVGDEQELLDLQTHLLLADRAHPVVALAPAGAAAAQRNTGKESVSRTDAVTASTLDG